MKNVIKTVLVFILLISSFFILIKNEIIMFLFYLILYIIIGKDVIIRAYQNIIKGNFFEENFLMSIATIGAFIIGEYPEAIAVMLFYEIGEMIQDYAVSKSKKSIVGLMGLRPNIIHIQKNDQLEELPPSEIKIGDIIVIKVGERVPLDGIMLSDRTTLDMKSLTGEALPKEVSKGDLVLSGSINLTKVIELKVNKIYKESTMYKILELVEEASSHKTKSEKFITKFSRYYTPIVVIIAILLTFIPVCLFFQPFSVWIYRSLSFLVISCPCALVISIPLSFFSGLGSCAKAGILVKGSNYLEDLTKAGTVIFDKTGTLTKGIFEVVEIETEIDEDKLLYYAASCEFYSNHPIARAIKDKYGAYIDENRIKNAEEIVGKGIKARIDHHDVIVGNDKIFSLLDLPVPLNDNETTVYIIVDNKYAGKIIIADQLKENLDCLVNNLEKVGINKTVILTGDKVEVARTMADRLGVTEYHGSLLPQDKIYETKKIIARSPNKVIFVGDGLNDAPVILESDIGISMGGIGRDAAIEVSDIVFMIDDPNKLVDMIKISKKTLRIIKQNIIFVLLVKIIILVLGAWGITSMWMAVFADILISLLTIINSLRCFRQNQKKRC